jgi:hypothetical protein
MELHLRYFWVSIFLIGAMVLIPGQLFPVCEGCCVCSTSAHVNERLLLDFFLFGVSCFFLAMSRIEEWANGS